MDHKVACRSRSSGRVALKTRTSCVLATTWRSRRELVRTSLHVDPVPGHGAIQTGDHLFYERHGAAGTEKLTGKAKFAMLWVLAADGQWKLSRVFSFAHRDLQLTSTKQSHSCCAYSACADRA